MIRFTIGNKKYEINKEEIKYDDFLIKKTYEFDKNKEIVYDRDNEIFEEIIIKIAKKEDISYDKVCPEHLSYINEELKFYCLPDLSGEYDDFMKKIVIGMFDSFLFNHDKQNNYSNEFINENKNYDNVNK